MLDTQRYLVTLPGPVCGHAPQRRVVVTLTSARGPGGHPVYADDTGELRVEIIDQHIARRLTPFEGGDGPLHAEPIAFRSLY